MNNDDYFSYPATRVNSQDAPMDRTKTCEHCGVLVRRPSDITNKQWAARRFCNRRCASLSRSKDAEQAKRSRVVVPVRDPEWYQKAACAKEDPDLFFAPNRRVADEIVARRIAKAKTICAGCPVRGDCLANALRYDDDSIAGGLTREERAAVRVTLTIYEEAS